MTPEQLSDAQDAMLAEAMATGRPSLWGRLNRFLWPTCSVCAGYRGLIIGMTLTGCIERFYA